MSQNKALIPVDRNKAPLVPWKVYQKRLPTIEEVEEWKRKFSNRIAGWAMPTGIVSGLVALDFDGRIGVETMEALGLIPNVKTASGSYHVWINSPGHAVRTGAFDKRWPGMELKGDGGYVIVVGNKIRSAHAGSPTVFGDYEILSEMPTDIDDIDPDLAEFILRVPEQQPEYAIARAVAEALEMAKEGRNNAGFWLACQLRDLGVAKTEAILHLNESFFPNVPEGNHEYSKQELKQSVDSAYSQPARNREKPTQVDTAVSLLIAQDGELWHDGKDGFITLAATGENIQIHSRRAREYLAALYFKETKTAVSRKTIDEALQTVEALSKAEGQKYDPKIRIGWKDDNCYVDGLTGIYEITSAGYNALNPANSPVKFIRNDTMGELAQPRITVNGDGWSLLRKYVNVEDRDWPLVKAVVLSAYMPRGAYPIVAFTGKHGSGKSTSVSSIISVTDPRPNIDSIRDSMPKDKRTLAITAKHSLVLAFDNESHITGEISDALAMLSTGGQMKVRTLYENSDLTLFTAKRLVLINSIGDIVTESDLLDRSIIIDCPPLDEYSLDSDLWDAFERDKPTIIGSIFNNVSKGIANLSEINPPKQFRMTDFVRWSLACQVDGFIRAYEENNLRAPMIAISNSFVGSLILNLVSTEPSRSRKKATEEAAVMLNRPELSDWAWVGPFSGLHRIGENQDGEWYKTLMGTSNAYKRVKTDLKKIGIEVLEIDYLHQQWLAIRRKD